MAVSIFKRLSILLPAVLALALLVALPARAVEFTEEGIIPAGQVVDDDLFISTDLADIAGTVNGDLFINSNQAVVSGVVDGNLIVNCAVLKLTGQVTGSLVFAGQAGEIDGEVDGTIYAAGNSLRLGPNARISRNLIYGGYALDIRPGAELGRDVIVGAYQAQITPGSLRNLNASVSALELDGTITGDVITDVEGPEVDNEFMQFVNKLMPQEDMFEPILMIPSGLRVSPQAQIGGKLQYQSPVNQDAAIQTQPAGGITYTQVQVKAAPTPGEKVRNWLVSSFKELATLLILGGLAAALFPLILRRSADRANAGPLRSAWKGLLILLGGFFLAGLILLIVIIVGFLIGIISLNDLSLTVFTLGLSGLAALFFFFLFMIIFGSKLVAAQWVGQKLLARFSSTAGDHRYWPVVVGVLIYVAFRLIPVVGFIVGLVATLIGLGSAYLAWRERMVLET